MRRLRELVNRFSPAGIRARRRQIIRQEVRRELVIELRKNQQDSGLILLDNVAVSDSQFPGPLLILGDGCLVSGCNILAAPILLGEGASVTGKDVFE